MYVNFIKNEAMIFLKQNRVCFYTILFVSMDI